MHHCHGMLFVPLERTAASGHLILRLTTLLLRSLPKIMHTTAFALRQRYERKREQAQPEVSANILIGYHKLFATDAGAMLLPAAAHAHGTILCLCQGAVKSSFVDMCLPEHLERI